MKYIIFSLDALDLMTSYDYRYCQLVEVLLCQTIELPYYVMKSNVAALVERTWAKIKSCFSDTEILFPCFLTEFEIKVYFQ